jgi:hypothetical protein
MKLHFILITLLFVGIAQDSYSQTKEIAWKSHSGSSAHFNPSSNGDLGVDYPDPILVRIEKLNDTTFQKTYERFNGSTYDEISYNDLFWMRPQVVLDSLAAKYYPDTKMVGFEAQNEPMVVKKLKKVGKRSKKNKKLSTS